MSKREDAVEQERADSVAAEAAEGGLQARDGDGLHPGGGGHGGGPAPLVRVGELSRKTLEESFKLVGDLVFAKASLSFGVATVVIRGEAFEVDTGDDTSLGYPVPLRMLGESVLFMHGGRWYETSANKIDYLVFCRGVEFPVTFHLEPDGDEVKAPD